MAGGINTLVKMLTQAISGKTNKTESMSADRALTYMPVWHCVRKITGAFVIMPLNVHRVNGREKSVQETHPVQQLTRWRPNAYQTPAKWKEQMICHALLWGNARSYIRRENGVPVELIPLMPDRTATMLVNGLKVHATLLERDDRVSLFQDMANNKEQVFYFADNEVWHVPGLGFDGIEGKSLISIAAQSWGIGLNAEKQIATQQRKGYAGGLMLEVPEGRLRQEGEAKAFLENFREWHEGADNTGKVGMLREGIKANVLAMSNSDAQFLEQRRFQREEAALAFLLDGILGDSSNASYNSLEQRTLAYRQNCLAPFITAIEEESDLKLLTDQERNTGYYMKFNDGALMRTEKSVTMAFGSQGIASRVLSPNEVRELFDLNPYDGGDVYENPAITPSAPQEMAAPTGELPTTNSADESAMVLVLRNLLSVEATRCRDMAKNSATFLPKIESWYASWETKLADTVEQLGGDRALASDHCEESMKRLLIATECQPEQLAESVAACVESWPNRVTALVEGILQHA
jgi:HK97 family phage portal protein